VLLKKFDTLGERQLPLDLRTSRPTDERSLFEKLITINDAAKTLGLPTWKLGRAAAQGVFPTYSLLNSRRLVRLSEVIAAIEASRRGGDRS
jgi:hypothetical protein